VTTLSDPKLLDGPWDLTVVDRGSTAMVFVSNVLNGTVTRIDLEVPEHGDNIKVKDMVQVASGYGFALLPTSVLVAGPTGLAFDAKTDTLYVASTVDNAIFAVHNPDTRVPQSGKGVLVFQDNAHLRGPLGLVLEPDGNLITANGDAVNTDPNQPSELVEFTPGGKFLDEFSLNSNLGAAFGLAVTTVDGKIRFAAVNDATNQLDVWTVRRDHDHDRDDRDHGHFSQDGALARSPGSDRLDLAAIFDAWLDSLDASSREHGAGR
jgi:DNA-binding beta-propeller fold protein YncE